MPNTTVQLQIHAHIDGRIGDLEAGTTVNEENFFFLLMPAEKL